MTIEKVLLVDDDPDIRTIGRMSLQKVGGWSVVEAANGQEGIEMARQEKPDVILMDMMMPVMDGRAALAEILEDPDISRIPVVFLTAKVQTGEVSEYVSYGAIGVIGKPFDPIELPAQIREIVARVRE